MKLWPKRVKESSSTTRLTHVT